MANFDQNILLEAHNAFSGQGISLKHEEKCGCFYCLEIFFSSEIVDWSDDKNGRTAWCPECGIDSILLESSGFPITLDFMEAMHRHWFYSEEMHPDINAVRNRGQGK